MRKFVLGLLLACVCLGMTGCGGCGGSGLSEASMRARSRKRTAAEKDDAPPVPAPVTTPGQANATPSKPATTPAQPASEEVQAQPAAIADTDDPAPVEQTAGSAASSGSPATSIAPAPPRYHPAAEHLAAKSPQEPLPEVGNVTIVVPTASSSEQFSPLDQRARTIDNLRRIGMALNAYVTKYGELPPQAIRNDQGQRTLSWRVAILPQLGHEKLYKQFRLHEPWDSPHNRQLATQIPPELQSPERRDGSTNYLAIVGTDTAIGAVRGQTPESFEDGAENTIVIVEADDEHAVAWTKPDDLLVRASTPRAGLGALRGDGFLSVMADGRVLRVPPELPDYALVALFTTDSGEPVVAANMLKQPTLEVAPSSSAVLSSDPLAELVPNATSSETAPASAATLLAGASDTSRSGLLPVPDDAALAASRDLLKELYKKQVEEARKPEQWAKIIPMLLAEAPKVEANPSDYYELLRIVRDIAAAGGDATSALKAVELMEQKFQIDPLAMRLKLLDDLLKAARSANAPATLATTLSQTAKELMFTAIDRDDYDSALKAHQQLLDYTKLKGDRAEIQRVTQTKPAIESAQKSFAAVPDAIKKLTADPNDADANETVGRYLCLVKGRWHDGLPLLVRGSDISLRVVAAIDLETARTPQQTISLADKYWEMAGTHKHPQTRNFHLRAVHCYQLAAAQLSGGLEKVKAQKRLEEANQMYGAPEVQKALLQMNPIPGVPVAAVPNAPEE